MYGNRSSATNPADRPVEGRTVRLGEPAAQGARHCRSSFPWWVLWTIWPVIFLMKSAAHLLTPLIDRLNQPLVLTLTPMPLLLIGAGVALLLIGVARRDRGE